MEELSIKEKAREVQSSGYDDVQAPAVERGFILGANYVLEQLEEFLNLYGIFSMNSSAKTYLKDMIEQLKK